MQPSSSLNFPPSAFGSFPSSDPGACVFAPAVALVLWRRGFQLQAFFAHFTSILSRSHLRRRRVVMMKSGNPQQRWC